MIYTASGDVTTSGDWTILDNDALIIIIDGNLTINGTITKPKDHENSKGLIVFVVNGTISVASSIGSVPSLVVIAATDPRSTFPVPAENLYGVFVSKAFKTGVSNATTPRLIVRGSVITDKLTLERDNAVFNEKGNSQESSELFIYDPQLLITLPDVLKTRQYRWEEVVP